MLMKLAFQPSATLVWVQFHGFCHDSYALLSISPSRTVVALERASRRNNQVQAGCLTSLLSDPFLKLFCKQWKSERSRLKKFLFLHLAARRLAVFEPWFTPVSFPLLVHYDRKCLVGKIPCSCIAMYTYLSISNRIEVYILVHTKIQDHHQVPRYRECSRDHLLAPAYRLKSIP